MSAVKNEVIRSTLDEVRNVLMAIDTETCETPDQVRRILFHSLDHVEDKLCQQ